MSLGYKRRKKAIKAGTYETPMQRSARVMSEFVTSVEKAIADAIKHPATPEMLQAAEQQPAPHNDAAAGERT